MFSWSQALVGIVFFFIFLNLGCAMQSLNHLTGKHALSHLYDKILKKQNKNTGNFNANQSL